jgi:hypothetical protein
MSDYKSKDNPKHQKAPLTARQMRLVPVEPGDKIVGGRKSRRRRQFKWVAA